VSVEPCLFCGSPDVAEVGGPGLGSFDAPASRFVQCARCYARGPIMHTVDGAVRAWGARAHVESPGGYLRCVRCGGPSDEMCTPCRLRL
jgi:hypothetical protein